MTKRTIVCAGVCLLLAGNAAAQEWKVLIDGQTLAGWTVRSGFATYEVVDGAIVGTTAQGSPNTFLCTEMEYGDFILEFEVRCDRGLNSGVQIRSRVADETTEFWFRDENGEPRRRRLPDGRVYGYQVEIPENESGWYGGIYDEARRGFFLGDPAARPEPGGFKPGEWNAYRVECRGNAIKTWVNGVICADLRDAMTDRGFIGLQVHSVSRAEYRPYQVRWRNIRIREID